MLLSPAIQNLVKRRKYRRLQKIAHNSQNLEHQVFSVPSNTALFNCQRRFTEVTLAVLFQCVARKKHTSLDKISRQARHGNDLTGWNTLAGTFQAASAANAQLNVDLNLGGPPVYAAPEPVYVEQYHHDHDPHSGPATALIGVIATRKNTMTSIAARKLTCRHKR
jgi:hypothetical protein